jgi:hypothetical protein
MNVSVSIESPQTLGADRDFMYLSSEQVIRGKTEGLHMPLELQTKTRLRLFSSITLAYDHHSSMKYAQPGASHPPKVSEVQEDFTNSKFDAITVLVFKKFRMTR